MDARSSEIIFCDCRVCREAAAHVGPEVRGHTSYNFGGVLQIDFGPNALQAFQRHREALNAIRHVLFSHAHVDHFSPNEFAQRRLHPRRALRVLPTARHRRRIRRNGAVAAVHAGHPFAGSKTRT